MSTAVEIVMPRLSDSMEEGTILTWFKADGDEVAADEKIADIETDKATMEFEAEADGRLTILVPAGETCTVGTPIARIESGSPTGPPAERSRDSASSPGAPAPGANGGDLEEPARPSLGSQVAASPLAKRIARKRGIELATVTGTGTGGRIVKADVLAVAESGSAPSTSASDPDPTALPPATGAKGEVKCVELTRMQRLTARKMAESKATAPDFTLERDVDMEAAVELRDLLMASVPLAEGEPRVPSYNDMVVRACALALREHPRVNGAYGDGSVELYGRINVGIAVAAADTLIVPIIHDADQLGLGEIARETRRLAGRVRDSSVTPPELSGGTFTVSNLGMYGIDSFAPVINPPQAAILGVGALRPHAVVKEDGSVTARQRMRLTLNCDHRILSGAEGAEFLGRVAVLLEGPGRLIL